MRSILALILIATATAATACSSPSKADPSPNIVCERVALVDKDAKCEPEVTDVGERHMHRARVTQKDVVIVCALADAMLSVECGPMFPSPKREPGQPAPATPQPPSPPGTPGK